jgi:ADP-ribosyl-[dinitrogen reductase] hydrolase
MRCAPLSLLEIDALTLERIAIMQSRITHAHPTCIRADLTLIRALKDINNGMDKIVVFNSSVETFPELAQCNHLTWETLPNTGYVVDTLVAGFWALLNSNSFEEALLAVINRGGDADTCGAVAGALCGAYYGLENIPDRWLNTLKRRTYIENLWRNLDGQLT